MARLQALDKAVAAITLDDQALLECPFSGCAYSGPLLFGHIRDAHGDAATTFVRQTTVTMPQTTAAFRVLLHAPDERVFLLVNGVEKDTGLPSLDLISVGPPPTAGREIEYTMEVRGAFGNDSVFIRTGHVPCVRRWPAPVPHFLRRLVICLLDSFYTSFGTVSVFVCQKAS